MALRGALDRPAHPGPLRSGAVTAQLVTTLMDRRLYE
jgi:hypothetical protein